MLSHKHSSSFKIVSMPFIPAPGRQKEWILLSLRPAWSTCRVPGQLERYIIVRPFLRKRKKKIKSPPNNYITYIFIDAFTFMRVYTLHACSGHRSQKRVSNLLELEVFLAAMWALRTKPGFSTRSTSAVNYQTVSPAPTPTTCYWKS